ncbi:hypothetical protein GCM10008967_28160 [Bacillus carboniphilus]|uniref:Uncharacterized protein n=1 Tax=Bacillus carboniphilus TaxID=86663 RepID=A0ABN0WFS0_9BACI
MHEFVEFIYLRPIFYVFVFILSVLLFSQRSKYVNGFSILSICLISSVISGIGNWQIGIIADELNLAGDKISFNLFFVIMGLSFLNLAVYVIRHKKLWQSQ